MAAERLSYRGGQGLGGQALGQGLGPGLKAGGNSRNAHPFNNAQKSLVANINQPTL